MADKQKIKTVTEWFFAFKKYLPCFLLIWMCLFWLAKLLVNYLRFCICPGPLQDKEKDLEFTFVKKKGTIIQSIIKYGHKSWDK